MKMEGGKGVEGDGRGTECRSCESETTSPSNLETPLQIVLGAQPSIAEDQGRIHLRNTQDQISGPGLRERIRKQHRGTRLMRLSPGQRPKNQTHLLQGQRLQKAHTAQSHPIQGWKGTSNTRLRRSASNNHRLRCSRKESVVMIANNPVMVVKRSPCSTRRRRQPRRSC